MMTPITLRPYQEDCISAIRNAFKQGHKRVILCAPTGAGKTLVFSYIVSQTLQRNIEAKTLILTDRIELHTQAGGSLARFGLRPEPITAGRKVNHRARCFVGMVETYYNRLKKEPELYTKFTQVIFDEAHKSSFYKILRLWDTLGYNPYVIGATATPIAAKKDQPLSDYYQAIVNRVQIGDLIENGYLSRCTTISAKVDRTKLKTDHTGDYSDASQFETFAKRQVYDGLLLRYQELCSRYNTGLPMKTIIFNVNVAHSKEVTALFNEAGIPARHVDGMTHKAERESIIFGYKSGAFPVICNVGILNAGFDDPYTRCIVMNRATNSVALFLQSAGRGSRIANGKDRFFLLDMGENWTELGLWESERDWETIWKQKKKKSEKLGVAPVKVCESCNALINLSVRICPECGYEYPAKYMELQSEKEFVEITPEMALPASKFDPSEIAELVKVDRVSNWKNLDVKTLEKLREYRQRKAGWVVHVLRERCRNEITFRQHLTELALIRGYKPAWVYKQEFKEVLDYAE